VLEGVIPLETFPLVEWHEGELADVPSFTVLKTQICVIRPQCVKIYIKILLHVSVNKPSSGSLLPSFAKVRIIQIFF